MPTFARTEPQNHQVTKSIISLLRYYRWRKFSVVYEEKWDTVAKSLESQAKSNNMTVNHMWQVVDGHKCCEDKLDCCRSGYWYQVIQETKNRTRSKCRRKDRPPYTHPPPSGNCDPLPFQFTCSSARRWRSLT